MSRKFLDRALKENRARAAMPLLHIRVRPSDFAKIERLAQATNSNISRTARVLLEQALEFMEPCGPCVVGDHKHCDGVCDCGPEHRKVGL